MPLLTPSAVYANSMTEFRDHHRVPVMEGSKGSRPVYGRRSCLRRVGVGPKRVVHR
jgi:hypothetical protein